VHLTTLHPGESGLRDEELQQRWERLLKVRDEALKLLEAMPPVGDDWRAARCCNQP